MRLIISIFQTNCPYTHRNLSGKERKRGPVGGGEVVEEDQHLKLGQLTAWTGMHAIPKRQVGVGFWWHLDHHKKEKQDVLTSSSSILI